MRATCSRLLDVAVGGCAAGAFEAIVTAPVQKSVINDAGIPFTGHTEYLAERTGARLPVMMLVGGGLRVALATTHLPLRKVSAAITPSRLEAVLRIVDARPAAACSACAGRASWCSA